MRKLGVLLGLCACTMTADAGADGLSGDTGVGGSEDDGSTSAATASTTSGTPTETVGGTSGGDPIFDLPDGGELPDACKVEGFDDAPGACSDHAPPQSFDADVQWVYESGYSFVTPLVANLTDDNGDGEIDLCDVPDIVVVVRDTASGEARIHLLDGATGALHRVFDQEVDGVVTPALGDLDGDGVPEIVSATGWRGPLVAFEHTGEVKWHGDANWNRASGGSVALADVDGDGDVEVMAGYLLVDHEGTTIWEKSANLPQGSSTTAADLDDDDDLEIIFGHQAYHHDGSMYFDNAVDLRGHPQVADIDEDGLPEVIIAGTEGISIFEHDGTVTLQAQTPTGQPAYGLVWPRPAAVLDYDGDGTPEFAQSSASLYSVFEYDPNVPELTISWSSTVDDTSGIAGGTAFDFLGDGTAEAMYADEHFMYAFDEAGVPVFEVGRTSQTLSEYPVVADVDNDGSAEIVVVSNDFHGATTPTVQVIRDREDRWIQARRIWNQHTYHVTNVREDGTIPAVEPKSWHNLNTFRANAQIEGGQVCTPQG